MTFLVVMLLFVLACGLAYRISLSFFRRSAFLGIDYSVKIDRVERLASENFTFSQTVTNRRGKPIACLKLEMRLPDGLYFLLPDGRGGEYESAQVESVFCLPAGATVTRTWFAVCRNRGNYAFGDALFLRADPLGTVTVSKRVTPEDGYVHLRVLPRPEKRLERLALTEVFSGCYQTVVGTTPDLTLIRGVREYTSRDPFNRIHFKASAKLGRLVVRECEQLQNDVYNIILNMQSRIMEPHGGTEITRPDHIEDCISVCASLLDSAAAVNSPVCLLANIPTEEEGELFRSAEFQGQDDLLSAYRMLAELPMQMSMPAEEMLDKIIEEHWLYERGGHVVMVSAYVDDRMIHFAEAMRERGVRVIFFITTSYQNTANIPDRTEIYIRYPNGIFEEVHRDGTA